jgi:hypothetical protein
MGLMWLKQCHIYHPFGMVNIAPIILFENGDAVMTGGW